MSNEACKDSGEVGARGPKGPMRFVKRTVLRSPPIMTFGGGVCKRSSRAWVASLRAGLDVGGR